MNANKTAPLHGKTQDRILELLELAEQILADIQCAETCETEADAHANLDEAAAGAARLIAMRAKTKVRA